MDYSKGFLRKKRMIKILVPIMTVLIIALATSAVYLQRKTFTVSINGNKTNYVTYKDTVKKALEDKKIQIDPKDKINPSLDSKLTKGETVTIKRAVDIKLSVDGKSLKIRSSESNIGAMLKAEGIKLGKRDIIKPGISKTLTKNMKVSVVRVTTGIVSKRIPVEFREVVKYNRSLANTKRHVVQNGRNGEMLITYNVTYENGKPVSKKVAKRTVVRKPKDMIIAQGTYPVMPISRSGKMLGYSKVYRVKATAYWALRGVGKTYTASGRKAIRNEDGYSTISVDPHVFPYGTRLFIEGYGFAVAADTGGAMSSNRLMYFLIPLRKLAGGEQSM